MKFFISTPIFYTNGSPHIGHASESIRADVAARWHRRKKDDVFFLTGTDEHGTKILRTAQERGLSPEVFVNQISDEFKKLKNQLDLSWDDFIRTTDKERHWPGVYKMWGELEKNGDIYEKSYQGLYCVGCESFKTGKDLIDGKCPDHLKEPELIEEKNYFFRLSKYRDKIEDAITSGRMKIMPQSRRNEVLSFIRDGLNDVSVSRPKEKLPWGIPVPGDDSQVIYVWLDALTNYISALGYGRDEENFGKWWNEDGRMVHMMAKDILRFHAAIWPGMLLSAGLPLPKEIMVHGYITSEGQKMSKSLGNVVSPVDLVERYGADPVRYYLLREIPAGEDGDFSEQKFKERYNGELANGLGNFAARVLTLASKTTLREKDMAQIDAGIVKKMEETGKAVAEKMEEYKFHEALAAIWQLLADGDRYVNETKPWEDTENKKDIMATLVALLEEIAGLISPFLPSTAEKISKAIVKSDGAITSSKIGVLFPRI